MKQNTRTTADHTIKNPQKVPANFIILAVLALKIIGWPKLVTHRDRITISKSDVDRTCKRLNIVNQNGRASIDIPHIHNRILQHVNNETLMLQPNALTASDNLQLLTSMASWLGVTLMDYPQDLLKRAGLLDAAYGQL